MLMRSLIVPRWIRTVPFVYTLELPHKAPVFVLCRISSVSCPEVWHGTIQYIRRAAFQVWHPVPFKRPPRAKMVWYNTMVVLKFLRRGSVARSSKKDARARLYLVHWRNIGTSNVGVRSFRCQRVNPRASRRPPHV